MDRHVRAAARLQRVQGRADLGDRLVAAVEGRAEDRDHADGVLVARVDRLRARQVAAGRPPSAPGAARPPSRCRTSPSTPARSRPSPGWAGRADRRPVRGRPAALERHPGEHARLAGAGGRAAGGRRPGPGRATGRRGWSRSAARARPSAGTRPCRSCSCRRHSAISCLACGSIQVVTNVARLSRALPSSMQLVVDQLVGDVGRHRPGRQLVQRCADPALEGGVRRAQEGVGLTDSGCRRGTGWPCSAMAALCHTGPDLDQCHARPCPGPPSVGSAGAASPGTGLPQRQHRSGSPGLGIAPQAGHSSCSQQTASPTGSSASSCSMVIPPPPATGPAALASYARTTPAVVTAAPTTGVPSRM